ncbi:MFS transporter [Brevibacillus daliensis]|uniref:MFS transporter n=1 Tax=Brevibacillus daliensis TaxID=2892995 RepID=UPI001E485265|nr:MFS transporter [Brevibacillus daliensis]
MENVQKGNIFANKFIRYILLAGVFVQIGTWVRNFAILLFVMDSTQGNSTAVSLIYVAEFAPIFLFSFIGGTYADRWRPKRTIVWCDILSAISVFAVLFTLIFGSWKAVFFVTLVSAILSQFSQPSMMKLFKQHVPQDQLQAAMAMFQTLMAIFMIIGPAIGTMIFQKYGITVSIAVTGICFLLSAAVLYFLPADQAPVRELKETTVRKDIMDGFKYVKNSFALRIMAGAFLAAGLAVGILQPLGVFVVVEQLGMAKENLQWFLMVNGGAMLVGGALVMGLSRKISPQKLLTIGMVSSAISVIGISFSTSFFIALCFQFINGLLFPCISTGINTIILGSTDEEYVGRVNGVLNPLFMGGMVIMMIFSGLIKEMGSLQLSYQMAGLLFIIGGLLIIPMYRETIIKNDSVTTTSTATNE